MFGTLQSNKEGALSCEAEKGTLGHSLVLRNALPVVKVNIFHLNFGKEEENVISPHEVLQEKNEL